MDEWSQDAAVDAGNDVVSVDPGEVEAVDAVLAAAADDVSADDVLDDDDVLVLEEVESAELVLPVWEPTGEPRVDAALDLLSSLDPDDVHQHAPVFDDIHQQLRAALTDLDTPA